MRAVAAAAAAVVVAASASSVSATTTSRLRLGTSPLLSSPSSPSASCTSAFNCSGAGACVSGSCVCESGFIGPTCSMLDNRTALRVQSGFVPYSEGWWAWGSSVLLGDDGQYHMLASVYPSDLNFFSTWLTRAQVVHASSPSPYGPFTLTGVALGYGDVNAWDRSLMNPKLLRAPTGEYLLFYTGDAYNGSWPSPSDPIPVNPDAPQSMQRVGVASSPTPKGPYTRLGHPILEPRPSKWDSRMVTNPAITLMADGSTFLMVYKASNPAGSNTTQSQVCLGVATATDWKGPWTRARDDPILPCPVGSFDFEDPCVWFDRTTGFYHLVVKDFHGEVTHSGYSGAHAISEDGLTWSFTTPALAYSTTHVWDDGKTRTQHYQERPQILLNASTGTPVGIYYATDTALNGSQGLYWNMFQPLVEGL
jgi:hypothetical protein